MRADDLAPHVIGFSKFIDPDIRIPRPLTVVLDGVAALARELRIGRSEKCVRIPQRGVLFVHLGNKFRRRLA